VSTGKVVYHARLKGPNNEIFVVGPTGGIAMRVTRNRASDSNPTWSSNGKRIAFESNRDPRGGRDSDIYVMRADGSERRLTRHPARDLSPAWSPDGRKIAFRSTRDGNPEIYVMNADGSKQRNLTRSPANEGWFAWSPKG
jgi:Tol biopolymer transport system component